ncbi:MAG TPA: T9SS type A sorting domain-containing protein, partial [Dyadobacter sp.]|nr:T9SS type A sorting domain-containing protein [Dyadobacter sp.]
SFSEIQSVRPDQNRLTELYPNPASDFINIKTYDWKNVLLVKIFDRNGINLLQFTDGSLSSNMDVSKLRSDTYLIEIVRKDQKTEHKRFIVVR